ncbi:hypothetical protein BH11GEM1_BH11GEM1_15220 [soil metagenome]
MLVAITAPLALGSCSHHSSAADADRDWAITGGDAGNSRFSTLAQVTRDNVGRLETAWVYHTGEGAGRPGSGAQMQATPIVVHGVLFGTSGAGKAFAVRADNGTELWKFDPYADRPAENSVNRGVVYWEHGAERRIFFSAASRLYALDATTGVPIPGFGTNGWIHLAGGLGRDGAGQSVVATSPGVIYQDLLIQGSRVGEGDGSAPGYVRAFDVRTGAVRWIFHTIPLPGEPGYETWPRDAWRTVGGANSWAGMAVDVPRGLVFIPTGSATPDFYGGNRLGANLYANSLLALDAATGRHVWHFQTIHHDLDDRDLPAAPNLLTVVRNGRRVDAVAQISKTGFVFLFDRATGAPLFPIEERPVPASDVPGEQAWPTQPVPIKPAPIARQVLTESDLTDLTADAHAAVLSRFRTLRNEGVFTPPSLAGSVVLPGFDGGGEWGGAAIDRTTSVMYVNASDVPWIARLIPATPPAATSATSAVTGVAVYAAACASCHGVERRGDGSRVPSLVDVRARLSAAQVRRILDEGRGFMPATTGLSAAQRAAVTSYVLGELPPAITATDAAQDRAATAVTAPYRLHSYERWKDPNGYPAVKPPWGTLNAIDLNTGEYHWKIRLGVFAELADRGIPSTGTEQYGGPIVTAGGIVFIAATQDENFRAFDSRSGALLWETTLPAAGYATPSTYMVGGRQYVVIATGGGKLGTKSGDTYVAFALPCRADRSEGPDCAEPRAGPSLRSGRQR